MTTAKGAWAKGIEELHKEASGVLAVQVVQQADMAELLGYVLAGDPEAIRVLSVVRDALRRIQDAPRNRPMLCASCPKPLRNGAYAIIAAFPAHNDAARGMGLAVCRSCGTTDDAIQRKALEGLRRIWPDVRPVTVTHPEGGQA